MTGEESAGTSDFSWKCVFNIEGNNPKNKNKNIYKKYLHTSPFSDRYKKQIFFMPYLHMSMREKIHFSISELNIQWLEELRAHSEMVREHVTLIRCPLGSPWYLTAVNNGGD